MIFYWIVWIGLFFGFCFILVQYHRMSKQFFELQKEHFLLTKHSASLKAALEFYMHVKESTPNPKFTGEVAKKAMEGELH